MPIETIREPLYELATVTTGILSERGYPHLLSLAYTPKPVQLSPSELRKASHKLAAPADATPNFEALKDIDSYSIVCSLPYPPTIWKVGMFSAQYVLEYDQENRIPSISRISELCDTQWDYNDPDGVDPPMSHVPGTVIRGLASALRMVQEGYPMVNGDWSWVSVDLYIPHT